MSNATGKMTLDQLKKGEHATVTALHVQGGDRRRMMDLGILPGTEISVEMVSPMGDPTAYNVRGSMIALRKVQAKDIEIERH